MEHSNVTLAALGLIPLDADRSGFSCLCPSGIAGRICEERVNACDPNPCAKPVQCSNIGNGSYLCDCGAGSRGVHCEIDVDECLVSYVFQLLRS